MLLAAFGVMTLMLAGCASTEVVEEEVVVEEDVAEEEVMEEVEETEEDAE